MIRLAPNYSSLFVRCNTDTTAFAPHFKLRACVFDFCHYRSSFQSRSAYPDFFESARRPPRCNPPDVCIRPRGRSTQVFLLTQVGLLSFLRCCQGQTKWACGTSGSERRDTIACRAWAIEKYSMRLTSIRCCSFLCPQAAFSANDPLGRPHLITKIEGAEGKIASCPF